MAAKDQWIQKAIKKPGALRSSLGVKAGEKIPAAKLPKLPRPPVRRGSVHGWPRRSRG